jgi:hypothetical protein
LIIEGRLSLASPDRQLRVLRRIILSHSTSSVAIDQVPGCGTIGRRLVGNDCLGMNTVDIGPTPTDLKPLQLHAGRARLSIWGMAAKRMTPGGDDDRSTTPC